MRIILLAVFILNLCSCATVLNDSKQTVLVHANDPSSIVYDGSFRDTRAGKVLTTHRSGDSLEFYFVSDSVTKRFAVAPRYSANWYANILCNFGIGMLVDRNTPRKFSYPSDIWIDTATGEYRTYRHPARGEIRLHISSPHVNSFYFKPEHETVKQNTGFMGAAIGVEYYYHSKRFVALHASAAMDFLVPFPAIVDYSGEYDQMTSRYIGITHNHRHGRLSWGYGLSRSRNTWSHYWSSMGGAPPPVKQPVQRSHVSYGLLFPAYYQFGKAFHLGLIYRPGIYRPQLESKFAYEHMISLDLGFKFAVKK